MEEDPFENWRVCKRKATIESREHTDSERNFKSIEDEELEGPEFKMEIVEITD